MVLSFLFIRAIRYAFSRPSQPVYSNTPRRDPHAGAAKALGVVQLILCVICIVVGSLLLSKNGDRSKNEDEIHVMGSGIITGLCIGVCGCLTVAVSFHIANYCLLTLTRIFNISATIGAMVMGCMFLILSQDASSLFIYYVILMATMCVAFFIALFAAIYAGPGCHGYSGGVIVINQQPQCQIITSHATTTTALPQHPYAMPPNQASFTYHGNGPVYTALTTTSVNSTNLAYTMQTTHDRSQLIDGYNGEQELNMQPPPYEA